MDVLTHGFLPYAAMTWMRRPRSHRALAALGGIAPDFDTLFAWLSHAHPFAYPLVHRGLSHTLWGAPLMATLALFLLSRPRLQKRWQRLSVFAWRPDSLGPLWFGAWSHLLLDAITITGIPLLWPFETTRFTTNWFFYGILYCLPFSLYGLVQLARGRLRERSVKTISITIVTLMLIAGVVRFASLPDDREPGSHLTPGPNDWIWYVTHTSENGTIVYATGLVPKRIVEYFPARDLREAAPALARCAASPAYVAVDWDRWGPLALDAQRTPTNGWRITYYDPVQIYARLHPGPSLAQLRSEDHFKPLATCTVTEAGAVEFDRERGWFGS